MIITIFNDILEIVTDVVVEFDGTPCRRIGEFDMMKSYQCTSLKFYDEWRVERMRYVTYAVILITSYVCIERVS